MTSLLARGLDIGALVAGRYRVTRKLGVGGMGAVYEAHGVDGGDARFAVKVLHAHLADDPVALARFVREAEAASVVRHPNVVRVVELGSHERDENHLAFLVMEHVEGQNVADVLAQNGPFGVREACRIMVGVLEGLAAVHASGVVHRDLKPENILLAHPDAAPKIFDFGVAVLEESQRALDPRTARLTPTGTTMGTPHYCSPEQLAGSGGRDPRVDVYGAGVVLYEMLAGHRPFVDADLVALCRRIRDEDPPPMRVFRKDVPHSLETLLRAALAKSPAARPPSAAAFREALRPFARSQV